MFNYLIALAIASSTGVPASAQTTPPAENTQAANPGQAAKPQTVKKLVCEDNDNPYSRIGRVCHTVEMPAQAVRAGKSQQAGSAEGESGN